MFANNIKIFKIVNYQVFNNCWFYIHIKIITGNLFVESNFLKFDLKILYQ